jgi:hypothetical protein
MVDLDHRPKILKQAMLSRMVTLSRTGGHLVQQANPKPSELRLLDHRSLDH